MSAWAEEGKGGHLSFPTCVRVADLLRAVLWDSRDNCQAWEQAEKEGTNFAAIRKCVLWLEGHVVEVNPRGTLLLVCILHHGTLLSPAYQHKHQDDQCRAEHRIAAFPNCACPCNLTSAGRTLG